MFLCAPKKFLFLSSKTRWFFSLDKVYLQEVFQPVTQ